MIFMLILLGVAITLFVTGCSIDNDNKKKKNVPVLYDRETGEETPAGTGTMTDLSLLKDFTGLEYLTVSGQPLESLDGIEALANLREIHIECCDLQDYSAVFSLPEIEFIGLEGTAIASLEGIGANGKLHGLWLNSSGSLTDLGPLEEYDFSYAVENGGFMFSFDNEKVKDLSFLSRVPYFCDLNIGGIDSKKWADAVKDCRVRSLVAFNISSQKAFAAFVETHRDIEVLHMPWNTNVTDLGMLPGLPNLQRVQISNNMKKAIKSLEGKEYSFELVIE